MNTPLSFDNTAIAFAHHSDKELKQAHWLFNMMAKPWLVKLGTRLTPWSIRVGLPVKGLIRQTIFKQFVGGESLEQTVPVLQKLGEYRVQVILDYGVEGKEGEQNYDQACEEFIRVIRFSATQKNVPFMSIKVTGMARFALLEQLDAAMGPVSSGGLMERYAQALEKLGAEERAEWERVVTRVDRIGKAAQDARVGFLIDAEESWIQDPVDALTLLVMNRYNKERIVVYNTYQLYRHDRLAFLKETYSIAQTGGFLLGAKLVRGAYMEKERKRAAEQGYPSPIQPDKASSDRDYDATVRFCLEHIDRIGLIVASHNEGSNLLAAKLMLEKGLPADHAHVHFSQLYGMSDNITYNLAQAGYSVSKYLPFGPIGDVVPYLMRRAQENTSVGGQTSRELKLIEEELVRRKGR